MVEKIFAVVNPVPYPVKSITKKQTKHPTIVDIFPRTLSKLLPNASFK
jgi:hypothetical protein